jgi:hypothetical protein
MPCSTCAQWVRARHARIVAQRNSSTRRPPGQLQPTRAAHSTPAHTRVHAPAAGAAASPSRRPAPGCWRTCPCCTCVAVTAQGGRGRGEGGGGGAARAQCSEANGRVSDAAPASPAGTHTRQQQARRRRAPHAQPRATHARVDRDRLGGCVEVALGQEAARDHAVRQQRQPVRGGKRGHAVLGAPVQQGVLHLCGRRAWVRRRHRACTGTRWRQGCGGKQRPQRLDPAPRPAGPLGTVSAGEGGGVTQTGAGHSAAQRATHLVADEHRALVDHCLQARHVKIGDAHRTQHARCLQLSEVERRINIPARVHGCMCACTCVRVCARTCVCVCGAGRGHRQ